jgi:hypothetical protein
MTLYTAGSPWKLGGDACCAIAEEANEITAIAEKNFASVCMEKNPNLG